MRDDPRGTALAFLVDEHLLARDAAEQALRLADTVLRTGLTRLAAAAGTGDLPACVEAAHALKGNLLNLGLPWLADIAQAVVAAARQGEADDCRRLAGELAVAVIPFWGE